MALLELKGITAGYGQNVILRDFNLNVERGEFVSLLGSSGCGKTTTLRLIAGFSEPMQGTISFDGRDYTHVPLHKRNFGFVFQSYALFPHMTVFDNVAFGLKMRKLDKATIERDVMQMLKLVDLEGFENRYPREMSGGQRQRVALARAMVIKPDLMLFDEPLSNLDAKLRLEMRSELQRLHLQTGSTFVYVTHDQMEAMTLATRICLMENGVLQQYDEPLTVYGKPSNLFVADFVGNPAINFIEAQGAQKQDGTVELTMLDGVKAAYTPGEPVNLREWFAREEKNAAASVDTHAVEKANRDSLFKYHIAKVEEDEFEDEATLTHEDFVIGVRPECVSICENGALEGEIFSAMPTGMETTVKVRVGEFLFTGVVFGGITYKIGQKVRVSFTGENVLLFSRENGKLITRGTLKI